MSKTGRSVDYDRGLNRKLIQTTRGARNFVKDTIPLSQRTAFESSPVCRSRDTLVSMQIKSDRVAITGRRNRGKIARLIGPRSLDRNIIDSSVFNLFFFLIYVLSSLSLHILPGINRMRAFPVTSFHLFAFVTVCPVNTTFSEKHLLKSIGQI